MTKKCHPELSWILFYKKSLLTTLRCRSSDFLFLRVCAIASHYTKSAYFRVLLNNKFSVYFISFGTFGSKSTAKLPVCNCVTCFGKLNPSG